MTYRSDEVETEQRQLALDILRLSRATVKRMTALMEGSDPIPGSALQAAVKLLSEASALADVQEVQDRERIRAVYEATELPFPASSPDAWGGE